MTYLDRIRKHNDLIAVAQELGCHIQQHNHHWQGYLPNSKAEWRPNLYLWPHAQYFSSFRPANRNDVIGLVQLIKGIEFREALTWLAKRAGLDLPNAGAGDLMEQRLYEDILTEAADWYWGKMISNDPISDYLFETLLFSDDIMEELMIGYAPKAIPDNSGSELATHLLNEGYVSSDIARTGLFYLNEPEGPFRDRFANRIIFPVWRNGKVVNIWGWASANLQQALSVESDSSSSAPHASASDDIAEPEYISLVPHQQPQAEQDLSSFIKHWALPGEESLLDANTIIIGKHPSDAVAAIDLGIAGLAVPVPEADDKILKRINRLTSGAEVICLLNQEGDIVLENNIGQYLANIGRDVRMLAINPGLANYFRNHGKDDLEALVNSGPRIPASIEEDDTRETIGRKTTNRPKPTQHPDHSKSGYTDEESASNFPVVIYDQTRGYDQRAREFALDPQFFKKRLDAVNALGVAGERNVIAMCLVTLDSRLLINDGHGFNTLSLKISGHFGGGKSHALKSCLKLYPPEAFFMPTSVSPKVLYRIGEALKHCCLIFSEGFQLESGRDSEVTYIVRSLLSEGQVKYLVTEPGSDGRLRPGAYSLEGPTSFITTTIMETLEPQLDDRLFTVYVDESYAQTVRIWRATAQSKSGLEVGPDGIEVEGWKTFHRELGPVDVIIPFAPDIVTFLERTPGPQLAARRSFRRVLSVIQAIACAYQAQRKFDTRGRLKAEVADYHMARQIIQEAFMESLGQTSSKVESRLKFIRDHGPVRLAEIASHSGVSKQAVSNWADKRVENGQLLWVDQRGQSFQDEAERDRSKSTGKAYLMVSDSVSGQRITGLPSAFELTGDPTWEEGGELSEQYDLALGEYDDEN